MYYRHIDGLRAIAVLSVIFYHLNIPPFTGGFVGVDMFFTISGYLITGIILRELKNTKQFSFTNFYFRRAKRIIPALLFVLLTSLIFAILLLAPPQFVLFGGTLASASTSIANIFLASQSGYFDIFSHTNPLLHTWSLAVEEQFYFLWPFFLLIAVKFSQKITDQLNQRTERKREPQSFPIFLIVVASVAALSLYLNFSHQKSDPRAIFYFVQYRAFEFIIGASVHWLPASFIKKSKILHEIIGTTGILLLLLPVFFYTENIIFPSYNALPPTLGTALLIYAGDAKISQKILENKAAIFIGLISYPLYLVHWPIIIFAKTWNEITRNTSTLSIYGNLFILVTSILLSFLIYKYIERPVRSIEVSDKRQQMLFIGKQCSMLFILALAGVTIFRSDGWLWRVNTLTPITDPKNFHQKMWGGADFKGGIIYAGERAEPSIVMMGDSHSGMLNHGIVTQIAIPMDLTVFTASGGGAGKYYSSLLLPGTTRIVNDGAQESADSSARNAYLESLHELHKSLDSVFIYSANYTFQIKQSGDIETHAPWNIDPAKTNNQEDYAPFLSAMDRMRVFLNGRKFLIIGEFPKSGEYNISHCTAQIRWLPAHRCSSETASSFNPAEIHMNQILRNYAKAYNNVYFIDPYDFLCSNGYCSSLDEAGLPIYSDNNHLSKYGSIYFFKRAKEKISQIIDFKHARNR